MTLATKLGLSRQQGSFLSHLPALSPDKKKEKQRRLPDNYASHSCAVKRGKNTFYNFLWRLLKTLDFGEAIRKRLNMRLDNDIPRDSCQGCLNTTQKQLLLRVGDHFKERWKKAKSASKCSGVPLGGAGERLWTLHKHP